MRIAPRAVGAGALLVLGLGAGAAAAAAAPVLRPSTSSAPTALGAIRMR